LGLAAVAAGLVVAFPHPPKDPGEKTSPGGTLVVPDKVVSFAPRAHEILTVAQQFVGTAVARKHVADSYDLVCPGMKQGYTRTSWAKGDIPVVPYPVNVGKWRISYSYATEVNVQVALFPRRKSKVKPAIFDLTVQPCGHHGGKKHWLVSSFIPTPSASGDFDTSDPNNGTRDRFNPLGIGTRNPPPLPNTASTNWLFLPLVVVGGTLLLAVAFLLIRGFRGRRAYEQHVRERQISNSRPS
jgi:hypothetical protein